MNDVIIMTTGLLVAICCSIVGTWLVLFRMSMMGDALSHAVLPGIVVAYVWTGSRDSLLMVVGCVAIALLMMCAMHGLRTRGVQGDAAVGVLMTTFFAIGVVLVAHYASRIDLDIACVLYGEMHYAPWMRLTVMGIDIGVRPLWTIGTTLVVVVTVITLAWRKLAWCAFDPVMAAVAGVSVSAVHMLVMGLVSVTTVVSFESVGAVLVLGMLVIPPVAASFLTRRVLTMLLLSVAVAAFSAIVGQMMATWLVASISGCIVVVAVCVCGLSALCAPERGLLRIAWNSWVKERRV
jgi:manganese/zinc/iron transport system permease protein